jgi:hypothetical protein
MLAIEAGLVLRTPGDPQHVFLPQYGRQLVEIGQRRPCVRGVAAVKRGAALC